MLPARSPESSSISESEWFWLTKLTIMERLCHGHGHGHGPVRVAAGPPEFAMSSPLHQLLPQVTKQRLRLQVGMLMSCIAGIRAIRLVLHRECTEYRKGGGGFLIVHMTKCEVATILMR